MRSILVTYLLLILGCTNGRTHFGVSVTNTGYHLYDVVISSDSIQAYLYHRGGLLKTVSIPEEQQVIEEIEHFMQLVHKNVTGAEHANCCQVTGIHSDSIGFSVNINVTKTNKLFFAQPSNIRDYILKLGLQISHADRIEMYLDGLVYNNECSVPWMEEYRNTCSVSYEKISAQLQQMVQNAIGINSNFTLIKTRTNRDSYYSSRGSQHQTRQVVMDVRSVQLLNEESFLGAQITVALPDSHFKQFEFRDLAIRINRAIFQQGIKLITMDHFTFLRLKSLPTIDELGEINS